jgi:hypothetical protein
MGPERGRWLTAGRAGYGAVLLLAPPGVLARLAGEACDEATVRVARVLGAREIVQAAILTARPGHGWQLGGAVVDVLHGASMLALAAASPRYRRLALGNARTAGVLALTCVVEA